MKGRPYMTDILLATRYTDGDVLPFLQLGSYLKKIGYNIILFTHCVFKQQAMDRGFSFIPIDDSELYDSHMTDIDTVMQSHSSISKLKNQMKRYCTKYQSFHSYLNEYNNLEKQLSNKELVVIGRFESSISAQVFAEKNNLPFLSLVLSPHYIKELSVTASLFGDLFLSEINSLRKHLGLEIKTSWIENLFASIPVFCLWPEWFSPELFSFHSIYITIGFIKSTKSCLNQKLNKESDDVLLDFISRKKTLLITGGTYRNISPLLYTLGCSAISCTDWQAVVVSKFENHYPKNLSNKYLVFPYLDFDHYLSYFDGVLHHGGIGTIKTALNAGVPQIVYGHVNDGPSNGKKIHSLEIGLSYNENEWTKEKMVDSLIKMETGFFDSKCKEYKRKLLESDPFSMILNWIMDPHSQSKSDGNEFYKTINPLFFPNSKVKGTDNLQRRSRILGSLKKNKEVRL